MKGPFLVLGAATALAFIAAPAIADHNSKEGEGWANMPNDIHNTRIETLETRDNEAFREFVKYGEGSDSVNRFDSEDTAAGRGKEQKGKAATEQAQAQKKAGTRKNEQVREQRQIRPEGATDRQRSMREPDTGYRAGNRGGDRDRSRGGRGRD